MDIFCDAPFAGSIGSKITWEILGPFVPEPRETLYNCTPVGSGTGMVYLLYLKGVGVGTRKNGKLFRLFLRVERLVAIKATTNNTPIPAISNFLCFLRIGIARPAWRDSYDPLYRIIGCGHKGRAVYCPFMISKLTVKKYHSLVKDHLHQNPNLLVIICPTLYYVYEA